MFLWELGNKAERNTKYELKHSLVLIWVPQGCGLGIQGCSPDFRGLPDQASTSCMPILQWGFIL